MRKTPRKRIVIRTLRVLVLCTLISLLAFTTSMTIKGVSRLVSPPQLRPEFTAIPVREEVEVPPIASRSFSERDMINVYVRKISASYNVDPALIMSIIQHESSYSPKAKTGNCLGLMQVSSTWHADRAKSLGVKDFYDPQSNILLGVDYISELLAKYKDPALALMLYNMNHDDALELYSKGRITHYARSVLTLAEEYRKGE